MQDYFAPLNFILLVGVIVAAIAALSDARAGLIPNWLTFGAMGVAPFLHSYFGYRGGGWAAARQGFALSLLGAAACAIVPFFLVRAQAMRMGDLKIFMALGAVLRAALGMEAEFYSFIAAGVIAVGVLVFQGKLLRTLANTGRLVAGYALPKVPRVDFDRENATWMPLGPAVFAGAAATALMNGRFW